MGREGVIDGQVLQADVRHVLHVAVVGRGQHAVHRAFVGLVSRIAGPVGRVPVVQLLAVDVAARMGLEHVAERTVVLPPELNFTFSNKFNELYSSGFYTYSASCDLPLSGVVTISRVPLVFHALHDLFL